MYHSRDIIFPSNLLRRKLIDDNQKIVIDIFLVRHDLTSLSVSGLHAAVKPYNVFYLSVSGLHLYSISVAQLISALSLVSNVGVT